MLRRGSGRNHVDGSRGGHLTPGRVSLVQLFLALSMQTVKTYAIPIVAFHEHNDGRRDEEDPSAWIYLITAIILVLVGGAFAGLTIALMGQDEVYLQVIATSGEGSEQKNATKVLKLLKRGKHWVLVTLLVGNVITNETLPIVLDRSIGGGYAAAITSTLLVIVFGEIVPQSICVRFGLPIGAWMADFVLILMWIFAPVTWPTAKLLDYLLGEDHGTVYKKAGLKTLVTLHKTLGTAPGERLNEDEVSIISGVLDLKDKPVGNIMTPMSDVFTLASNAILDEDMMDEIMREGYSRIPIHAPNNRTDFVGMLLVKMLITYDPEDAKKVHEFSLATLPETKPNTSCLDIINFFQQGKSHMVMVSDFPGRDYGALGVVTLEDVIEELIGEEIIDESDVFIDIHKAIRRMAPAPTHRARIKSEQVDGQHAVFHDDDRSQLGDDESQRASSNRPPSKRTSMVGSEIGRSPKPVHFLMRRKSSQSAGLDGVKRVEMRHSGAEMRQQLKNLGPSNAANKPRASKVGTVTIKAPGIAQIPENGSLKMTETDRLLSPTSISRTITLPPDGSAQGGIGHDTMSPGHEASDAVQAIQASHAGYGTVTNSKTSASSNHVESSLKNGHTDTSPAARPDDEREPEGEDEEAHRGRRMSHSTIGSMHSGNSGHDERHHTRKGTARSGSITEQFVDSGGVRKLVLETTSSSEEGNESSEAAAATTARSTEGEGKTDFLRLVPSTVQQATDNSAGSSSTKAKKRRSRRKKSHHSNGGKKQNGSDESQPLL